MIDYAPPELAAAMVPRLLRGEEIWCQGFSEPGTGSNLASLACRATRTEAGWRINGQKVWTSLAQYAQRCVLLTRTGTTESAHKGITALFVDMDSAGITVRPIETMHGAQEFCEVFFDDVVVPLDRVLGEVDRGWSIAMDLLPYERSTALWHRAAYLRRRLEQLVAAAPPGALDPGRGGPSHRASVGVPGPVTGDATQAGGRRDPRCRDVGRQGARRHGGAGGVRPRRRRPGRRGGARGRPGAASAGGPSSSTHAPPPFTAAVPRSSATSSPDACSTSGPTADGGDRAGALRGKRPSRHRERRWRRPRRCTGGARLAGCAAGRPCRRRVGALRTPGRDDHRFGRTRLAAGRRARRPDRPHRSGAAAAPRDQRSWSARRRTVPGARSRHRSAGPL